MDLCVIYVYIQWKIEGGKRKEAETEYGLDLFH